MSNFPRGRSHEAAERRTAAAGITLPWPLMDHGRTGQPSPPAMGGAFGRCRFDADRAGYRLPRAFGPLRGPEAILQRRSAPPKRGSLPVGPVSTGLRVELFAREGRIGAHVLRPGPRRTGFFSARPALRSFPRHASEQKPDLSGQPAPPSVEVAISALPRPYAPKRGGCCCRVPVRAKPTGERLERRNHPSQQNHANSVHPCQAAGYRSARILRCFSRARSP